MHRSRRSRSRGGSIRFATRLSLALSEGPGTARAVDRAWRRERAACSSHRRRRRATAAVAAAATTTATMPAARSQPSTRRSARARARRGGRARSRCSVRCAKAPARGAFLVFATDRARTIWLRPPWRRGRPHRATSRDPRSVSNEPFLLLLFSVLLRAHVDLTTHSAQRTWQPPLARGSMTAGARTSRARRAIMCVRARVRAYM